MRVRFITTCALGLAAALSLANTLTAQTTTDSTKLRTTTSQTRINISKGEVVPARVDTVYVTRYDTVTNTVTRIDTVTVTSPAPVVIPKIHGPFYFGAYAGSTWPWGNIDRVYTNGYNVGGVLGWEARHSPLGLRFDGSVAQLGREFGVAETSLTPVNYGSGTALLMQLGADAKLNLFMTHGWNFYGIGGLNGYRYKRLALTTNADGDNAVGNANCDFALRGSCYINANNNSWDNAWGFNFGAGTDFHIGSQDMFLEARYMGMQKYDARSWTLPISLGVRFF
jgi:hypothetical protein